VKALLLRWWNDERGEYLDALPLMFAFFLALLTFLYGAFDWLLRSGFLSHLWDFLTGLLAGVLG